MNLEPVSIPQLSCDSVFQGNGIGRCDVAFLCNATSQRCVRPTPALLDPAGEGLAFGRHGSRVEENSVHFNVLRIVKFSPWV